jgi:hypothetical protein
VTCLLPRCWLWRNPARKKANDITYSFYLMMMTKANVIVCVNENIQREESFMIICTSIKEEEEEKAMIWILLFGHNKIWRHWFILIDRIIENNQRQKNLLYEDICWSSINIKEKKLTAKISMTVFALYHSFLQLSRIFLDRSNINSLMPFNQNTNIKN